VISVKDGVNIPRYPSVPGRIKARKKPVDVVAGERPDPKLEKVRLDLALSRSILAVDLAAGSGTLAGVVPVAPLAAVLGSEESRLTEYRVLPGMVPTFADVSLAGGTDAACDAVSFGAKLTAASTALRPTTLPSAAPSGLPEIGAHVGMPGQKVPSSAPSDLPAVDGVHVKE